MRMAPKKHTRGPGVISLLLFAVFLIGAIFFLSNPEGFNRAIYPLISGENDGSAAASSTVKDATIVKEATTPSPAKRRSKAVASTAPLAEVTPPAAIAPAPEAGAVQAANEEPVTKPDPRSARIKTDSTIAYSSTSSRSSVVSVLEKDTKVDVTFELANSEGQWSMIRTEGLNQPVFVRSENVERPAKN